jgi:magnesium chelatase subunit D
LNETWSSALLAATCVAIAPSEMAGVRLCAFAGPVRDRWINFYSNLAQNLQSVAVRKIPCSIESERLLGGIDIAATLAAGRPIKQSGVLTQARGGTLLISMAERLPAASAMQISQALDEQLFAVIAIDEASPDDAQLATALRDRLSIEIDLNDIAFNTLPANDDLLASSVSRNDAQEVLRKFNTLSLSSEQLEAIYATSVALGINSIRAEISTAKLARMHAALFALDAVDPESLLFAVKWVLAPRATQIPSQVNDNHVNDDQEAAQKQPEKNESASPDNTANETSTDNTNSDTSDALSDAQVSELAEVVLKAAITSLPPNLLASLKLGAGKQKASAGTSGDVHKGATRGRGTGSFRQKPQSNSRIHLLHTLRAAIPWQTLRRNDAKENKRRVSIRKDDFRYQRIEQKTKSTIIFAIDASGSSALNRLAEAKGAIELLLAQCYVRRDQVAVIAFRGRLAPTILPPTRSLTRAKRSLSALPGGGGTPLAAALENSLQLALQVKKKGETPFVVMLTDGRANVGNTENCGRTQAQLDANNAAKAFVLNAVSAIVIDTSPQPHPLAKALAASMGAQYQPLPLADPNMITKVVTSAYR